MKRILVVAGAVLSLLAVGCNQGDGGSETASNESAPAEKKTEPEVVQVQHILIAFQGSIPGPTRSKEDAEKLANEIFKKAESGTDFDELVKEYTDDSFPGKYTMANFGVTPPAGAYQRDRMVAAFGDVGFPLDVGGIGMAPYDPQKSKYGWHIIKRIQ